MAELIRRAREAPFSVTIRFLYVVKKLEIMVNFAPKKFDGNGNPADEETREKIKAFFTAFAAWIVKMRG